jgi:cation:H+ antiporter
LGQIDGVILAVGLIGFTYYSFTAERHNPARTVEGEATLAAFTALDEEIAEPSTNPLIDVGLIVVGLAGLVLGAEWLVGAAESLARAIGVSELIIGLTLVAIGTSLPELATTMAAVRQGQADIAVGNVVGSNLFNMLFIGGISAIVRPLNIPPEVLASDYWIMLGITILVFLLALSKTHRLKQWHGTLLLAIYIAYTLWLFFGGGVPL